MKAFKIAWYALNIGGCVAFGSTLLPPEHSFWALLPCVATAGWYLGSREYWGRT